MTDKLRTEQKRSMAFPPAELERQAELSRLAPFVSPMPCACGSRNRTRNNDGAVFCQRCGKKHQKALPRWFGIGERPA